MHRFCHSISSNFPIKRDHHYSFNHIKEETINMPLFTLCLVLLFAATLFSQVHASKLRDHGSLVLGMSHARALSPPMATLPDSWQNMESVVEPLRGYRDGYLISLNLGTPPQVIQVYMDTGSDLTWVPCGNFSFECVECDDLRNHKVVAAFSPSSSSSSLRDLCSSALCPDVHSSDNSYDPCTMAGCSIPSLLNGNCPRPCPSFAYTYGGGGFVIGVLARDTLRVHTELSAVAMKEVANLGFGCVSSTYREPIGIAGFGKGALSLISQLGFLQTGFSHCFLGFKYASNPNVSSPLVIGSLAISSKEHFLFTPMLKSPMYPNFYYIGLEGISIANDAMISAPSSLRSFDSAGNGGTLIDSGTTYTHLPEPFYSTLLSKLASKISYPRSSEFEQTTGFDLCYEIPCSNSTSCSDKSIPSISLHLLNGVKFSLPKESCIYAMSAPRNSKVVKCFLFQVMNDGDYGPGAVFGSFQQQNMEVVYDLESERIGFQPMDCAASAATYGLHHS